MTNDAMTNYFIAVEEYTNRSVQNGRVKLVGSNARSNVGSIDGSNVGSNVGSKMLGQISGQMLG